jgi:hypothetical protein
MFQMFASAKGNEEQAAAAAVRSVFAADSISRFAAVDLNFRLRKIGYA